MRLSKAVILVLVVVLLGILSGFSTKSVSAAIIETPVCTNPATQRWPEVSGNIIVWQDDRNGNEDIYMYDLSTGTETPVCTNPADQSKPKVSGNIIVWEDNRNGNEDIYMYDLLTRTETPVCTNPADQWSPAVSRDIIVWTDERNSDPDLYNSDIYMYDLSTGTETPVCTNSGYQYDPAVSGDIIVWIDGRDGNSNIYMYDLSTGTETPVCTNTAYQGKPKVSGDIIVWQDERNGDTTFSNADVYMYDLSTGTETPVCTNPAHGGSPAVSGNIIVWSDYRNGNNDIYMCVLDVMENFARVIVEDASREYLTMKLGVQDIAGVIFWEYMPLGGWRVIENIAINTFDLSDLTSNLPPDDDNTWFVEITTVSGNQAKITEFCLRYSGIIYTSTDPPVPIYDIEPSYAYLPPCTEMAVGGSEPPLIPCWILSLLIAFAVAIIIIIILIYRRSRG